MRYAFLTFPNREKMADFILKSSLVDFDVNYQFFTIKGTFTTKQLTKAEGLFGARVMRVAG